MIVAHFTGEENFIFELNTFFVAAITTGYTICPKLASLDFFSFIRSI